MASPNALANSEPQRAFELEEFPADEAERGDGRPHHMLDVPEQRQDAGHDREDEHEYAVADGAVRKQQVEAHDRRVDDRQEQADDKHHDTDERDNLAIHDILPLFVRGDYAPAARQAHPIFPLFSQRLGMRVAKDALA